MKEDLDKASGYVCANSASKTVSCAYLPVPKKFIDLILNFLNNLMHLLSDSPDCDPKAHQNSLFSILF